MAYSPPSAVVVLPVGRGQYTSRATNIARINGTRTDFKTRMTLQVLFEYWVEPAVHTLVLVAHTVYLYKQRADIIEIRTRANLAMIAVQSPSMRIENEESRLNRIMYKVE